MESDEKQVPLRRDGSPRSFWYDRDWPNHIMHRRKDGTITVICAGHVHG